MKLARGPRPWTIHVFALLLLSVAVEGLIMGLSSIDKYDVARINAFTGIGVSRDGMIVVTSAIFTIILIPIVAIWLFGSRVARWLITAFTVWGALVWGMGLSERYGAVLLDMHPGLIRGLVVEIASWTAILLLFLPASSRWFRNDEVIDPETFA